VQAVTANGGMGIYMKIDRIRALAVLMGETGLYELCLEDEDGKVTLKRGTIKEEVADKLVQHTSHTDVTVTSYKETDSTAILSPLVGIFYTSPSTDEPPFVSIGQSVKVGDVLCIIEAMKLMNEIVAEKDGVVTQILVSNGQTVEYGQALFTVDSD